MTDPRKSPRSGSAGMDGTLLARMIGRAGDPETIRRKATELAGAVCAPLEAALAQTAGFSAMVALQGVELGLRSALEAGIGESDIRCLASVQEWCQHFTMSTSAAMAIAFADSLMGGSDAKAEQRPLSPVELDISAILFEQLLGVLKRVTDSEEAAATAGAPAASAADGDDERPDVPSVAITLQVSFGDMAAPLQLLLPQETVLKTAVILPEPAGPPPVDSSAEWIRNLSWHVRRSNVTLRARIRLSPMTLGDVARLKPGDVLPFEDEHDVEVRLDANGRELARCELGRSGSRYMLRLKPAATLETELMRDLP